MEYMGTKLLLTKPTGPEELLMFEFSWDWIRRVATGGKRGGDEGEGRGGGGEKLGRSGAGGAGASGEEGGEGEAVSAGSQGQTTLKQPETRPG